MPPQDLHLHHLQEHYQFSLVQLVMVDLQLEEVEDIFQHQIQQFIELIHLVVVIQAQHLLVMEHITPH